MLKNTLVPIKQVLGNLILTTS